MNPMPANSIDDNEEFPTLMYNGGDLSSVPSGSTFAVGVPANSAPISRSNYPASDQLELDSQTFPTYEEQPSSLQHELNESGFCSPENFSDAQHSLISPKVSAPVAVPRSPQPIRQHIHPEPQAATQFPTSVPAASTSVGTPVATPPRKTDYVSDSSAPFAVPEQSAATDQLPQIASLISLVPDHYTGNQGAPTRKIIHCNPREIPTTMVWGIHFACLDMAGTLNWIKKLIHSGSSHQIITANLNYVMLNDQSRSVAAITRRAAMVVADGWPIVTRSKIAVKPLPCRVAGSDLICKLAELSNEFGYRIYFLGGAEGVAEKAAASLKELYPNMQIAGIYSPPFRKLTDAEEAAIVDQVRSAETDILLVAFGQPKGEAWIETHKDRLGVPVSIQLGASFDFVAGTIERAPAKYQKLGLEWFYRMLRDPKRLLPRYTFNGLFLTRKLADDIWNIFSGK